MRKCLAKCLCMLAHLTKAFYNNNSENKWLQYRSYFLCACSSFVFIIVECDERKKNSVAAKIFSRDFISAIQRNKNNQFLCACIESKNFHSYRSNVMFLLFLPNRIKFLKLLLKAPDDWELSIVVHMWQIRCVCKCHVLLWERAGVNNKYISRTNLSRSVLLSLRTEK